MHTINLGGEERQLRFSHIAMKSMEKHYEMGFNKIFKKVDMESMSNMGVMLWACMRRYDTNVKLEDVEIMLDDALEEGLISYDQLGQIIKDVFEESSLAKQGKEAQAKNKKGA